MKDIQLYWDDEKNGFPLTEEVPTRTFVWWKCENHEERYYKRILDQIKYGVSCNYCSGHAVLKGFNDLATTHPHVIERWDYEKNDVTPEEVKANSNKLYYFLCKDFDHSFPQNLKYFVNSGMSCVYCSNRRVLKGFNDLQTMVPEIAQEVDISKGADPARLVYTTSKKIWWVCSNGHEYERSVKSRTVEGAGCPYCMGSRILPGFNDVLSSLPDEVDSWDFEKNDTDPTKIIFTSEKKVWWICDLGHSYLRSIYLHIKRKWRCPYCSNKELLSGYNDVVSKAPHLVSEWDYNKNDDLPENVKYISGEKFWWVCKKCGSSFHTSLEKRVNRGQGCPYCAGCKTMPGMNDFATKHPHLLPDWDYEKNEISPGELSSKSHTKVWWKCNNNHSWQASPNDRARDKKNGKGPTGCPICNANVSLRENDLFKYVVSILPEEIEVLQNTKALTKPKEIDIYIPDKKIAIEFNGVYWHTENKGRGRRFHYNKWKMCKDQGVQLITIWEDDWRFREDIVKKMIAHKLGVDSDQRVYARETEVHEIEHYESSEFLDNNHIQGKCSGTVRYGLFHNNNLVAVSVWSKRQNMLYLDRYATSCTVVGGMGKLLKYGRRFAVDNGLKQIVTFADHEVSDGKLYEKLGFEKDKELSPDYKYAVNRTRKHKFGYRLKRFKNDPELIYRDSLTELQLAELNDLHRVWDCGKTRYVIDI